MRNYDVAINWNSKQDCYFAKSVKALCRDKGLSFLWIYDGNARLILRGLLKRTVKIAALIDTEATYNDPGDIYSRICYAAKDTGSAVINDPDYARISTDKSSMHYRLSEYGIEVPYTLVIRSWQPKVIRLSRSEKKRLGIPFIIKPSQGYGQKGLVRSATGSSYGIAKARAFDPKDNFLLQKKITPHFFGGKKGWFRVFRVFDRIIPCWWDDATNRYKHVSRYEFKKYNLSPLSGIGITIAEITGMVWFSTEIAVISGGTNRCRYICIDYVNDQCDMTPVSETPNGVPDHVVDFTAKVIVENIIGSNKQNSCKNADYSLYFR